MAQTGPSPGVRDLKWLKPVHAGDTVAYEGEIVALRALERRPQWGLITSRSSGTNQRSELVFSCLGAVLIERRPGPDVRT